ncbi:MAG: CDP-2,3-bis-(O-geranylgeranyl)-sn-glycerol synthase [Candidatus ainarchaeum sp.]|nr:CDP-2,3-bis-(O-geranylgeranyl)-sn-glycerol synthase [Candidatus ainarchaeum sp.]
MIDLELIIIIFAYVVPLYFANASPIIVHGKIPLDFGKKVGGERILGKGKTILGTLSGIFFGSIAGFVFSFIYPNVFLIIPNYLLLSFFLSFGAIIGDICESFFKRRFGFKSGQKCIIFDQIDFIIGGLIFSFLILMPKLEVIIILLFATIFVHSITNIIAFKLGLKKVPW